SSLSTLQAFAFDRIKIDQSFISSLPGNRQSATIVRAVIGLGRGLGLPVIAEGVETEDQLAFLAVEDCLEVQGYLVGKPLPIKAYAEAIGREPLRSERVAQFGKPSAAAIAAGGSRAAARWRPRSPTTAPLRPPRSPARAGCRTPGRAHRPQPARRRRCRQTRRKGSAGCCASRRARVRWRAR